ncbi:MAG TPA: UDP-N-acetylmuramoyl-L-alanyl-D-glutamate--2,6-diaminopimelate ligase [Candidatus Latescibacteria bacterium]|nr:UDP-N-acetylmuramoyl-L-alanyl-D-glutamate--2,6-diaminopimelate ligase [Candidatus Latescibacterota bacterium]
MKLSDLLKVLQDARVEGEVRGEVSGVRYDSRKVGPGDVFVALRGEHGDGHMFVGEACRRGAVAVVLEREVEAPGIVHVVVKDTRKALALLSAHFFGEPARKLKVIGVTGTNGKTTVSFLIRSIFEEAGVSTGLIGTVEYIVGGERLPAPLTTPFPPELHGTLVRMVEAGEEVVVMEVSSHALALDRVYGMPFQVGVFTNLSRDHLDFHGTMEEYFRAKSRLFEMLEPSGWAVYNGDDPYGYRLGEHTRAQVLSYGLSEGVDVRAEGVVCDRQGVVFMLRSPWRDFPVRLRLSGRFNVYNALAAAGVGLALGIGPEEVVRGLVALERIPGRFERVDLGQDFEVIVDYAHTPDALEHLLRSAREITQRRLLVVFGCGGDRDRGKRPQMGEVAGRLADFVLVTSDNPRSEHPGEIIEEIVAGIPDGTRYAVEEDRGRAIGRAIQMAQEGDVVVIAGKGHEVYQIVEDKKIPFDDREVARRSLEERMGRWKACGSGK